MEEELLGIGRFLFYFMPACGIAHYYTPPLPQFQLLFFCMHASLLYTLPAISYLARMAEVRICKNKQVIQFTFCKQLSCQTILKADESHAIVQSDDI